MGLFDMFKGDTDEVTPHFAFATSLIYMIVKAVLTVITGGAAAIGTFVALLVFNAIMSGVMGAIEGHCNI